jgi:hypothetical protein
MADLSRSEDPVAAVIVNNSGRQRAIGSAALIEGGKTGTWYSI